MDVLGASTVALMRSVGPIVILSALAGCATVAARFAIERVDSDAAQLIRIAARAANGGLIVSGELAARTRTIASLRGQVVVQLVAPDGRVLEEISTDYDPVGKVNRRERHYVFSVTLPTTPPPGGTVRVRHVTL